MTSTPSNQRPPCSLPGQSASAEGPLDLGMMQVVHHGLRRDLRRLTAAAASTPTTDTARWEAQRHCWSLFLAVLEDHHTTEDLFLWPVLRDAADESEDRDALTVLDAVEREHDELEPLLDACTAAYEQVHRSRDRTAGSHLGSCLEAAQASLEAHLRHEETDAVPILHTYMEPSEWARINATYFGRSANRWLARRLLPWLVDGLSADAGSAVIRMAPLSSRLLLPLTAMRHRTRSARAFAHVASAPGVRS